MVYNTRSKSRNRELQQGVSIGAPRPGGNDNGSTAHSSGAQQAPHVNIDNSAPPIAVGPTSEVVYFPHPSETHQVSHVPNDNNTSPACQDSAPQGSHDLSSNSVATRSTRSAQSSGTIKARKLAAEALHARQLCDIAAQQAELERKAADLHLQAELAAIESESVRGSVRSSSVKSSDRSSDYGSARTDDINRWLHDVQTDTGPLTTATLLPHASDAVCRQVYTKPCENIPNVSRVDTSDRQPLPPTTLNTMHRQPYAPTYQNVPNILPNNNIPNKFQVSNHYETDVSIRHNKLISALESLANKPKRTDVKLPIFDGKSATDWLCFKRIFIDTQASFTTVENLSRISSSLRGTARDAVYVLLVSASDPMEVIDALEMRFGRPEKIVMQEINAVRALPKVSAEVENPNFDQGYFGPWRVCKRLLYNREKCGTDVSKFHPLTAVYIAGVVASIGVSVLALFCVLSVLQLAMISSKERVGFQYTHLVMMKLALALLATLLSIVAASLFAVQGNDRGFYVTRGEAFYVQIASIVLNSLLFIMSVYDALFSRRAGGDPTNPLGEPEATTINNPGFKEGRGISMTDASGKPYGSNGHGSVASMNTTATTLTGASDASTITRSPLRSSLKKPRPREGAPGGLGIQNPGYSGHSPTLNRNGSQKKVRIQTHSTEV